jgi:GH25 family lysozyme M1 (1,4-beta-N-acetylmuramidase)
LDSVIIFSDIFSKNNRNIKNLDIKDIYIENLEKFREILKKSFEKKVIIYTRNKKTIKNFLDYNNIS